MVDQTINMWSYQYVVLSICGLINMWSYQYVVLSICGPINMWSYQYVKYRIPIICFKKGYIYILGKSQSIEQLVKIQVYDSCMVGI